MVLKYAFLLFLIIDAQWTCDAKSICFSSIVEEAKIKTG